MLFNSVSFLIFFPIVFVLYYLLPARFRILFLLLASCYFYMSFVPEYILILFFLITADYFLAHQIGKHEGKERTFFLVLSVIANVGTLFLFKYFNFFNENISALAHALHWNYSPLLLTIALPLGLSFHVFQSLSYVIEVYKRKFVPEKSYLTYALYVMFFPQLVAGPIEHPQHLLPQLHVTHQFNFTRVRQGLERMLWGFFKKLVIADQLAQVINPLYAHLPSQGVVLLVIAILFSYQLYCDFSGYSDIAIGTAMMLGFTLTENFDRPYASRSVTEFWRRWHISLSSWLKDYLYYPLALGWGKISKARLYISLFITFVLIGLWHGANWTYVVFGALHGVYLIIESVTEKIRKRLTKQFDTRGVFSFVVHVTQVLITFALVSFSFIIFRSENLSQAWLFIRTLVTNFDVGFIGHQLLATLSSQTGTIVFFVTLISILLMEIIQYKRSQKGTFYIFDLKPKLVRYGWYYVLTSSILLFGYFGAQAFIYFQF